MNLGAATACYVEIERDRSERHETEASAKVRRKRTAKNSREHRAAQVLIGRCINEHGKPHAAPAINPKTNAPYVKCEECRATARGEGNAGKRKESPWR